MTAQDVAGVIARLRANPHGSVRINTWENINEPTNMIREAADLLESQASDITVKEAAIAECARTIHKLMTRALAAESRLAEAMRVIEPFGNLANTYFSKYEVRPGEFRETYSSKPDGEPIWAFNGTPLTHGHLRAARDFLNAAKEKT